MSKGGAGLGAVVGMRAGRIGTGARVKDEVKLKGFDA